MTFVALGLAGLAVAALAAVYPFLPKSSAKSAFDRADWVNRLFRLAGQADVSGSDAVAKAARELIAAIVADKDKA